MKFIFCLAIFLFATSFVESNSSSGDRLLAILKDGSLKVTHSNFFNSLKARGYKITFGTPRDSNLVLQKYGEYLYDHLLLFVSGSEDNFAPKISVSSVVDFIDSGRNVFLATDNQVGDAVSDLATEVGVEFDEEDTFVIDHFNHHADDKIDHTLIVSDQFGNATIISGSGKDQLRPVLFRGVGHVLTDSSNGLNIPILSGYPTTYSFFLEKQIGKKTPKAVGRQTALVSLLRARNNARVVISGSLETFGDKFFDTQVEVAGKKVKSGNRDFATRVSEWVFQERGVLRVDSITHSHAGSTESPQYYTIKDEVQYSIKISTWDGQKWAPFSADDVQFEFVRLDPYIRTFLKPDQNGNFNLTFTVPDVYGVFSFIVDYSRPGWSSISTKDVIPIRPFRHNQYERFIVAAYPYYASALSMLVGVFFFSTFFLYSRDDDKKKTN